MKKIVFFLLMLLSIEVNCSPVIYNNTGKNLNIYEQIFSIVAKDLGLDTAQLIVYVVVGDLNPYMSNRIATISEVGVNQYVIHISDTFKETQVRAFIHELAHLRQCYQHRLIIRNSEIWFEGMFYNINNVTEVPLRYEQEAETITDFIFARHRKELKIKNLSL